MRGAGLQRRAGLSCWHLAGRLCGHSCHAAACEFTFVVQATTCKRCYLEAISIAGLTPPIAALLWQAELYTGVLLLAPMVSLEKVSQAGLNPYLL